MYLYKDGQKAYVEKEQLQLMLDSGWSREESKKGKAAVTSNEPVNDNPDDENQDDTSEDEATGGSEDETQDDTAGGSDDQENKPTTKTIKKRITKK